MSMDGLTATGSLWSVTKQPHGYLIKKGSELMALVADTATGSPHQAAYNTALQADLARVALVLGALSGDLERNWRKECADLARSHACNDGFCCGIVIAAWIEQGGR